MRFPLKKERAEGEHTIVSECEDIENASKRPKTRKPKNVKLRHAVAKTAVSLLLVAAMLLILIWSLAFAVAHGASPALRDSLVIAAKQASATKWVPHLVLSSAEIDAIVKSSEQAMQEVLDTDDIQKDTIYRIIVDSNGVKHEIALPSTGGSVTGPNGETYDEWDFAVDGIQYIKIVKPDFLAYMLIVKDPSRVFVGTSGDFSDTSVPGYRFYDMANKYDAVALINGGEFQDIGGVGNGGRPLGLTYSQGKRLWNDSYSSWKTFIGFDKNNNMVIENYMSEARAEALGVRDGVCFSLGNTSGILVKKNSDGKIVASSFAGNTGRAQRSAIGQREDGAVIMLVTDGRSSESAGATYDDMTQIMLQYGAVNAGMLDGGSSAVLYYRDWFNVYKNDVPDVSSLDEYQKMGVINKYVLFGEPRRIPTYFVVGRSAQ